MPGWWVAKLFENGFDEKNIDRGIFLFIYSTLFI
jgi:hypothetical protein